MVERPSPLCLVSSSSPIHSPMTSPFSGSTGSSPSFTSSSCPLEHTGLGRPPAPSSSSSRQADQYHNQSAGGGGYGESFSCPPTPTPRSSSASSSFFVAKHHQQKASGRSVNSSHSLLHRQYHQVDRNEGPASGGCSHPYLSQQHQQESSRQQQQQHQGEDAAAMISKRPIVNGIQRHLSTPSTSANRPSTVPRIKRRPSLPLLALDQQGACHQGGGGIGDGYHGYDATQILEYLYLGSEGIPSQASLYNMFNVTHIVNVACQAYYPHSDGSDYLQLNIKDDVAAPIAHKFEEAFHVIEHARQRGHACLVHCRNGMSRSATVVIAYLMCFHQMPLIEAFKFVRDRRPCISPNPGFMRQLAHYELNLFGKETMDVQRYEDDRFGEIHHLQLMTPRPGAAGRGGEMQSFASAPSLCAVVDNDENQKEERQEGEEEEGEEEGYHFVETE